MNKKAEAIAKALVLMFNLFKEKPSKEVLSVYINYLAPYDLPEIKQAITKAVAESEFCPKPATLLKYLKPSDDDIKAQANNEAGRVLDSIRRGDRKCLEGDPLTAYLMNSRWSLRQLQNNMLEADSKWFQKEFIDAYICYCNSPRMLEIAQNPKALENSQAKGLIEQLTKKMTPKRIESKKELLTR